MVFIQTGMEEIPHTCAECELSGKSLAFGPIACSLCIGRDNMKLATWANKRRAKGCPLVEILKEDE